MIPGIGIKGAVHLLELFGDARSIFAASVDELVGRAELRPDLARAIVQRKGFSQAEKELRYCERNGLAVIASTDLAYPPLLREIPDNRYYFSGGIRRDGTSRFKYNPWGTFWSVAAGWSKGLPNGFPISASSADWPSASTPQPIGRRLRRESRPSAF